jgi:hypothetical protein
MMWLLRRQECNSAQPIDPRCVELQAAKEILAEIFRVRAGEVEEMIRSRMAEDQALPEGRMWPATFLTGEQTMGRSFEGDRMGVAEVSKDG